MTNEQQTVSLTPEAVYFRQKFHDAEDSNAVISGQNAVLNHKLGQALHMLRVRENEVAELRGEEIPHPDLREEGSDKVTPIKKPQDRKKPAKKAPAKKATASKKKGDDKQ